MEHKMFCYQCQETVGCKGCTVSGVCGKTPDVAAMQDLLVWVTKGLSAVTTRLRAEGKAVEPQVNHLITWNLFTTITNANFDKEAIIAQVRDTLAVKAELLSQLHCQRNGAFVHRGNVQVAGLRLFEVAALALHGEDQSFQTHGKSHCRCGLSAHLFDQSVIPAAAADSPLCADVGGDKLENGLGIIIQTTNDLRVDGEVDIQRLQIFLELFEVCPAVRRNR